MGRENETKQIIYSAASKIKALSLQYEDKKQFIDERFMLSANTHQSAIVSGTTFSNSHAFYPPEQLHVVLDASATGYMYDEDGVRIGISMATASAQANADACESFVNNSQTILSSNLTNNQFGEAIKASLIKSEMEALNSRLSLAATSIYRQSTGALKAIFGNVGGGMILIVDGKTGEIKKTIAARDYGKSPKNDLMGSSSNSIQKISLENFSANAEVAEVIEVNNIEEDDVIIQLTDGIWSEFEYFEYSVTNKSIGDQSYREKTIQSQTFQEIIRTSVKNSSQSAVYIGQAIIEKLAALTLSRRITFYTLLQKLKPYRQFIRQKKSQDIVEDNYTISKWINDIGETEADVAAMLEQYLEQAQREGIPYDIERYSAENLDRDLCLRKFGNDATLAIMRVPCYKTELIRALIENPKNKSQLLTRIAQTVPPEEFNTILHHLKAEIRLPNPFPASHPEYPRNAFTLLYGTQPSRIKDSESKIYCDAILNNCLITLKANHHVRQIIDTHPGASKEVLLRELVLLSTSEQNPDLNSPEAEENSLNVAQLSEIFNICHLNLNVFNTHRNPNIDKFFGINHTKTWSNAMKQIRNFALTKLFEEVKNLPDIDKKIEYLERVRNLPLFNQHRSNFVLTGAWGRTEAVREIDDKIIALRESIITIKS